MAVVSVKVDGFKEIKKALDTLGKVATTSVLRSALRKAGTPVVHTAMLLAPKRTGDLASSVDIRSTLTTRQKRFSPKQKGEVELFIGPSHPTGAHGHLLEFGTSRMPAKPFLRPAWDTHKEGVLKTLEKEIWDAIERVRRRLARRATVK